jgi:tripeptide aminopeptidase
MTGHAEITIQRILESEAFRRAVAVLHAEHERTVEDIIRLTETESPTFHEAVRARTWHDMAKAHGLSDLEIDAAGNVTGLRRGIGNGPMICIAAHLDTVFPGGTDVKVRREGTKLFAPGVGDDTRGLAVLLAWVRAMDAAGIQTRADILFVADVGEEGTGDLRGMRHLFQEGRYKDRISAFMTIDGPNMERIVTGGVGSKRYRVTFKAPGGHSYGSFGAVNPLFAMADAISRLGRVRVPGRPRTTYSASVTGGGTSINSIPNAVWTEFDLRSESVTELTALQERFIDIVHAAVAAENETRSVRNESQELVRFAKAAIEAKGFDVGFDASSTDANIPMSLGIPAIRIGSGGTGGREHSLDEWIDVEPTNSLRGMEAGLAAVLAVAGVV